jgi:Zn-dependent protease with chaperone function
LFKEVYLGASEADPNLSKGIQLYIKEDMTINAFAFGKSTLVLTRGSLELLSDDCLKGFIAHELGHFSHGDTKAILLATVSNYFMSKIVVKLTDRVNRYENENRSGFIVWIVKGIYRLFKAIDFIGEVILKRTSRRNEYLADSFAQKSGFGEDLAKVLVEIYSVSVSKPQSVKEQLKSTHPDITLRIERLEEALYQ